MWRRMPCWCSPPAYLPPPPPLPTPTLQLPAAEASSDDLLQSLNQKAERTEQWAKTLFGDKNMKTATARLAISKPKAEAARITRERQLQSQQIETTRITKKKTTTFKCRRCSEAFANNIKFHDHVRTKHTKKFISHISSVSSSTTSSTSISSFHTLIIIINEFYYHTKTFIYCFSFRTTETLSSNAHCIIFHVIQQ